jgi:hypothetical protein
VAAVLVDPGGDLVGVEADEVAPLDERDASLEDKPTHVARSDAEMLSQAGDVQEVGQVVSGLVVVVVGGGHGLLLGRRVVTSLRPRSGPKLRGSLLLALPKGLDHLPLDAAIAPRSPPEPASDPAALRRTPPPPDQRQPNHSTTGLSRT